MAQHCNRIHGWRSTPGEREHWSHVRVQTFSQVHGKQRYFIVQDDDEQGAEIEENIIPAGQSDVDEIMEEFDRLDSQHQQALGRLDEEMAKTDQTGWWKRTGWPEHLKGSTLKHLSRAARLPDKNEVTLRKSDDAQQTDSAGGDRFSDGESLDIGQQNDLEGDPDIVPAEATVPDGERNNMYDARRLFPWREGQKALA
ncbi:hypothetical protein LTR09_012942 [Extremus antarcticus]|uniref:Uncharacterized protein n=1 Tax=Extremus antarcticus TaxID=702011 RepID=A0AAJ0G8V4_9PEZI|nr:hypothetical protein LTR09_012942 [Extremus antarcticus]